jgi:hypothetical protein
LLELGLSDDLQLQKEKVQELKVQWKRMWYEHVDDQWRAEGIASEAYPLLFVDKGTVIRATRDFKALSLKEILELHQIPNLSRYIPPDPAVGGWTRFAKTHLTTMKGLHRRNSVLVEREPERQKQQLKKGGRGWLHK